jgi:hypothetical protein
MIFLKIALLSAIGVILIIIHQHYYDIPTNGYSNLGYAIDAPPPAILICFVLLFVLLSGFYFIGMKIIAIGKKIITFFRVKP